MRNLHTYHVIFKHLHIQHINFNIYNCSNQCIKCSILWFENTIQAKIGINLISLSSREHLINNLKKNVNSLFKVKFKPIKLSMFISRIILPIGQIRKPYLVNMIFLLTKIRVDKIEPYLINLILLIRTEVKKTS